MAHRVLVLVGTQRGLFILESKPQRKGWVLRGPLASPGWAFGCVTADASSGVIYAGGHNAWFGAAVWVSRDQGATWSLSSEGMTWGEAGPPVKRVWQIAPAPGGALYAGVDPAGLFVSGDGGANWAPACRPLGELPLAQGWKPGKAGLPVHSIVHGEAGALWVAMAGGGVLFSPDGGATWEPRNPALPESGAPALRPMRLKAAPGRPGRLYQQNHFGVFRTDDGGLTWLNVSEGLPTRFGFALAVDPHDPDTVYTVPMRNEAGVRSFPDNRLAVWRSRNGGASWVRLANGLPADAVFTHVLRHGLAADSLDPAGIYFGTSSGHVYGSVDGGDTWATVAENLPEILAVATAVVD